MPSISKTERVTVVFADVDGVCTSLFMKRIANDLLSEMDVTKDKFKFAAQGMRKASGSRQTPIARAKYVITFEQLHDAVKNSLAIAGNRHAQIILLKKPYHSLNNLEAHTRMAVKRVLFREGLLKLRGSRQR